MAVRGLDSYDKKDARKAAKRLREFTIPGLSKALGDEYTQHDLEVEVSHWPEVDLIEKADQRGGGHNRYRWVSLEDLGQQNMFGGAA